MKKKIPGIIVLVLGCLVASANPTGGGALVIIGVVMLIVMKDKKKAGRAKLPTVSGPTEYPVNVIISKQNLAELRTPNPTFKNPRNTGRPVYEYKFFEEECQLVPTDKTINVMYNDVQVGYVDAVQADAVRSIMGDMIGAPRLRIYGGEVKNYEGGKWVTGKTPQRAEVRIQYMAR
jgi:hypothetical protein